METSSCPLGPGTVETGCSARRGSTHLADVQGAIDRVVQARPELFDLEAESPEGSGQYRVLDADAYLDAVVGELRAAGFCAQRGLDGETVQVKDTNELSEDFDVILSNSHIRRNAYLTSCRPAAFPVTPGRPHRPGAGGASGRSTATPGSFPPSTSRGCSRGAATAR